MHVHISAGCKEGAYKTWCTMYDRFWFYTNTPWKKEGRGQYQVHMEGRLPWGCFAGRVRLVYVYVWQFQKDVPCRAPYFGNKIVTWTHGLGPSAMCVQQERSATELKTQCVLFKMFQTNNLALPSDRAGQVTGSSAHHPVASLLDSGWSCCVVNVALLLSCRHCLLFSRRGRVGRQNQHENIGQKPWAFQDKDTQGGFTTSSHPEVSAIATPSLKPFRISQTLKFRSDAGSCDVWLIRSADDAVCQWSEPGSESIQIFRICDSVRGFVSWFVMRDPIWLHSHKCFLGEAWCWNCTNTFLKVAPIWLYTPGSRRSVVYFFLLSGLFFAFFNFCWHHLADYFNSYMMFLLWWLLQNLTKSRLWIAFFVVLIRAALPPPSFGTWFTHCCGLLPGRRMRFIIDFISTHIHRFHRVLASSFQFFASLAWNAVLHYRYDKKRIRYTQAWKYIPMEVK